MKKWWIEKKVVATFLLCIGIIILLIGELISRSQGENESPEEFISIMSSLLVNGGGAIITTALICFLENWFEKNEEKEKRTSELNRTNIERLGIRTICHKSDTQLFNRDEEIFNAKKQPKELSLIFCSGFRSLTQDKIEPLVMCGCNVRIILSNMSVIQNGTHPFTNAGELNVVLQRLNEVVKSIAKKKPACRGSLKVRKTNITPIAGVEICDNICNVLPYLYPGKGKEDPINEANRIVCFDTGEKDSTYDQWKRHFNDVWNASEEFESIVYEYKSRKEQIVKTEIIVSDEGSVKEDSSKKTETSETIESTQKG